MKFGICGRLWIGVASLGVAMLIVSFPGSAQDTADAIEDALGAAWPGMVEGATVVDWEGNVLQEGSNGYTCLPTAPMLQGRSPRLVRRFHPIAR